MSEFYFMLPFPPSTDIEIHYCPTIKDLSDLRHLQGATSASAAAPNMKDILNSIPGKQKAR